MSIKEIHNVETGEIIRRELNADELAQAKQDKIENDKTFNALKIKEAERNAVLTKLGLSVEEAAALLG
jgi:hypothetical protein